MRYIIAIPVVKLKTGLNGTKRSFASERPGAPNFLKFDSKSKILGVQSQTSLVPLSVEAKGLAQSRVAIEYLLK